MITGGEGDGDGGGGGGPVSVPPPHAQQSSVGDCPSPVHLNSSQKASPPGLLKYEQSCFDWRPA